MTKDYLAAARDAERRKAWAEGTYYATMAIAAGTETTAVLNFEAPLTAEQAAAIKATSATWRPTRERAHEQAS